jgi:GTP-binding protein
VTDQDAHIAAYILESGRAVVVAVNKWDATDGYARQELERSIASRLQFLRFAEVLRISALKRQGIGPVWKAVLAAYAAANRRLPTPLLTRELQEAVLHQQPPRAGRWRPKLRYAHQGGSNPPVIIIHGNSLEHVADVYKRYLENRFRARFELVGTPLRIEMRSGKNPYAERDG